MLWLSATASGASILCSLAVAVAAAVAAAVTGLQEGGDSESSRRARFNDGGAAAGGGDTLPPNGCRPLFVVAKKVSTIPRLCTPRQQLVQQRPFYSLLLRRARFSEQDTCTDEETRMTHWLGERIVPRGGLCGRTCINLFTRNVLLQKSYTYNLCTGSL